MNEVTIRYKDQTHRITHEYWGDDSPAWADVQRDGETVTTTEATQQARTEALTTALNSVEAGTDYDPDTEVPVGKLCYAPDTDELYAEVDIQPLPDTP